MNNNISKMSIYLEVTNGKYAASAVLLEDGDVARVGRGAQAEWDLAEKFRNDLD